MYINVVNVNVIIHCGPQKWAHFIFTSALALQVSSVLYVYMD